ncbi:hypothetical protein DID88_009000 [Monilinia fructigena]|uniref:Uncharacterized protein n=1 Tax=Monilinia fructigena TaxID=38457 RepID=A0A395IFH3_9HELO|nr:hypothetical protein DID88_009000 [Monilinia fructigena]
MNVLVSKARKPKFDLVLRLIDLNNVPLTSGTAYIKWSLPNTPPQNTPDKLPAPPSKNTNRGRSKFRRTSPQKRARLRRNRRHHDGENGDGDDIGHMPQLQKSSDKSDLHDMYRVSLAASWSASPFEMPADECIEDIFFGGRRLETLSG